MADITIHDLALKRCKLSVWDQTKSNCICPFSAPHSMTLYIADGRDRKPGPWFHSMEFESMEQWDLFVRLVRQTNRRIRKAEKDDYGFPVLEKEGR